MKKVFWIAITFFLGGKAYSGDTDPSIYLARGFRSGHCYQHLGVRSCQFNANKPTCTLEIFPHSSGSLSLQFEIYTPLSTQHQDSADIGLFSFEYKKNSNQTTPKIRLISRAKINLSDILGTDFAPYEAVEIPCPALNS